MAAAALSADAEAVVFSADAAVALSADVAAAALSAVVFSANAAALSVAAAALSADTAAVILFHTHVLISGVFSAHNFLCTFSDKYYRNTCCLVSVQSSNDLYMHNAVPLYPPFINHNMVVAVVAAVSYILYLIPGYPHVVFLRPAYKRYI